jgi:hypothetical protein
MDKVQKHNSFNTNTPSSEYYRNYTSIPQYAFMARCSVCKKEKTQEQVKFTLSLSYLKRLYVTKI